MSKLYVAEFRDCAHDAMGNALQAPMEPAVAVQAVDFSGGEADSSALNDATHFVLISTDANCHYAVGKAPTAVDGTSQRLAAGEARFFGVQPGRSLKVSAIAATT